MTPFGDKWPALPVFFALTVTAPAAVPLALKDSSDAAKVQICGLCPRPRILAVPILFTFVRPSLWVVIVWLQGERWGDLIRLFGRKSRWLTWAKPSASPSACCRKVLLCVYWAL